MTKFDEKLFKYIVDANILDTIEDNGIMYFKTIKEALYYTNSVIEPVIFIKNGTYKEKIHISKSNLTIIGESNADTIIEYDDYAGLVDSSGEKIGTFRTATVTVHDESVNFKLFNITIRNSWDGHSKVKGDSQAVAFRSKADKSVYYKVNFEGFQDTLFLDEARHYLHDCKISGDVDYIFGGANVIFDACTIVNVARPTDSPRFGYIAAPRTNYDIEVVAQRTALGFLFRACNIKSELDYETISEDDKTYLARPWRRDARAVFIECNIGYHVSKLRWTFMHDRKHEDAYFREFSNYNNTVDFNVLEEEMLEYYCSSPKVIFDSVPRHNMYNGGFDPKPIEDFNKYNMVK